MHTPVRRTFSLAVPGALAVVAVLAAACGDKGTPSAPVVPPVVEISVSPTTLDLQVGQTQSIAVSVSNASDRGVTWRSSNDGVATVSAAGAVTGVAPGNATITATANADPTKTAVTAVTVRAPVVVTIASHAGTVSVGGTLQLTAGVTGTTNTAVAWSSSNAAVATVSNTGLVTGVSAGTVTITATSAADGTKSATTSLTVSSQPITISIAPGTMALTPGQTQQLTAALVGTTNPAVTWSSSAPSVASVDGNGMVTAVAQGTAVITVRPLADPTKIATAIVTVMPAGTITLTSGVAVTGLSAGANNQRYMRIVVPAGATELRVQTGGGTGDLDLYLRHAQLPTGASFDCRSEGGSNTELCTISNPAAGDWFIMLYAFTAYNNASLTATVTVATSAGYLLSTTPTAVTLQQGATAAINVDVARTGGFNDAIAVRLEGLPTGVSAPNATIQPGATSTTIILTATGTAATGTTTMLVRGTAAGLTDRTAQVPLSVVTPGQHGFSLTMTPTVVHLTPGGSTTLAINLPRVGGFTGVINLSAEALPAGVTATFSPAAVAGSTSTLTLTASTTATLGSGIFTVRARAQGLDDRTVTGTVNVQANTAGALNTSLSTYNLTVARGQNGWVVVNVLGNNYTGSGTISLGDLPPGVTATFPLSETVAGSATGTFSLTGTGIPQIRFVVAANAPLGTSAVTVRARGNTPGVIDGVATLNLTVVDAQAPGSPAWTRVAAAGTVVCGTRTDDRAYCWGGDFTGDASIANRLVPTTVWGEPTFTDFALGQNYRCGLTSKGQALCWGNNEAGTLGRGTGVTTASGRFPTEVSGGLSFIDITGGRSHVCGLTASGSAYCWGSQQLGQLGDGFIGPTIRAVPGPVNGGRTFTSIAAGGNHTCGLDASGQAYCWGNNEWGQLGDMQRGEIPVAPVVVNGTVRFTKLAAADEVSCGIATTGLAYCWGRATMTGDNAPMDINFRLSPTPLSLSQTFIDISASATHACAVATGGQAYCWGSNFQGALGNGQTGVLEPVRAPVAVHGGIAFQSITTGTHTTCGIATNGRAYCWGLNSIGQIGDGTTTNRTTPTAVRTF
jgi:alpha-tubulin suppressor-like RCC1 family protein/uncharacterized protein YjdB